MKFTLSKKSTFYKLFIGLNFVLTLNSGQIALACTTCFNGDANDPMNKSLSFSMLALLVVLVTVLGLFAKFFLGVRKRSMLAQGVQK